jgi:hypothetical protein
MPLLGALIRLRQAAWAHKVIQEKLRTLALDFARAISRALVLAGLGGR